MWRGSYDVDESIVSIVYGKVGIYGKSSIFWLRLGICLGLSGCRLCECLWIDDR